uniref:Solute carrier family 25 member 45 n=1 Tax=Strigamia maritima TaxID=126957 RepID=T1JCN6_STRMM
MEYTFDFMAGWVRLQTKAAKSTIQCIIQTYRHEKIRGFYNGMAFPLLTNGVSNCIFFGTYGTVLRLIGHSSWHEMGYHPPIHHVFFAGTVGGLMQLIVDTPTEVIKTRLQSQKYGSQYIGPLECFKSVYSNHGVRGCYKGLYIQLLRDLPASAIYMVVYDLGLRKSQTPPSVLQIMFAGGMAGLISWACILPLDVIKTRIQADNPLKPKYRGVIHCFVSTFQQHGITIFGRGFWAMAIRAFPTNAVIFLTYSWVLDFCHTLYK